jgi:hypothetical protein
MAVHDARRDCYRLADSEMGSQSFIHVAENKLGREGGKLVQPDLQEK